MIAAGDGTGGAGDLDGTTVGAKVSEALREARTEAVVVLAVDVALLGGLAFIDKVKGWDIINLPWWAWVLLASPALLLMILLPLERRAKGLMAVESLISYAVVILVVSRAVNVLGAGT